MNAPDGRAYCECGHLLVHHDARGRRPCREQGCPCAALDRMPALRCTGCGHPVRFRTRVLPGGGVGCSALGCTCVDWTPDRLMPVPARPATDAVRVERVGGGHLVEVPHPGPGERVNVRITPTGQVQVEIAGRMC